MRTAGFYDKIHTFMQSISLVSYHIVLQSLKSSNRETPNTEQGKLVMFTYLSWRARIWHYVFNTEVFRISLSTQLLIGRIWIKQEHFVLSSFSTSVTIQAIFLKSRNPPQSSIILIILFPFLLFLNSVVFFYFREHLFWISYNIWDTQTHLKGRPNILSSCLRSFRTFLRPENLSNT